MDKLKKWWLASIGHLKVSDQDLTNWSKEKNLPMLNYVLIRGSNSQIMKVLQSSRKEGYHLRLRLLQMLTGRTNQEISEAAVLCLIMDRPFYYNVDWPL